MTRTILWVALACAACGDDRNPGSDAGTDAPRIDAPTDAAIDATGTRRCGAMGTGTITGTVMGEQITPVVRAYQVMINGFTSIVIDELGTGCGAAPAGGEHLAIVLCAAPAVRTYPVVGEPAFACPSANAFGLMEQNAGADFANSTGGTVSVTDVSGGCTTGTFTIDYLTEQLTGTFDAYVCP